MTEIRLNLDIIGQNRSMAKMTPIEKFFVNSPVQRYFHRIFGFGKFLRKLPSNSYTQILEIGSGAGFTSELLVRKYPSVKITATDFDEDLIKIARQKQNLSGVIFQQEDATKLSFPDGQFDVVFAVLVLHHIENFAQTISEMARVLKPGGLAYVMDIPSKSFNFVHFRRHKVPGLFSKIEILNSLISNGLEVVDYGGRFLFILEGKKK